MNTQLPILNVASPQKSARPTTQADSFTADVPFNQVLNKEVSNRNNDNQSKPKDSATDAAADAAKPSATPAPSNTATSNPDSSTKTASNDDKSDEDQDAEQSTTDAASAQMLALVANLSQIAVQPAGKKSGDADMDALANQKGGKKGITVVSAKDQKDLADLQSQDDGKSQGKKLDISAMVDSKDTVDDKAPVPSRTSAEKTLPESPVNAKATFAEQQDAANAARSAAKPTVEVAAKPAEIAAQPNASAVIPTLQQTMTLSQQAAMAGQAVQRLTPSVGSPGWDQAVGQKVLWMATNGMQSASLTLNPPDLGPLQVVIHVNNQHADATFITAQPEVKQALENAMPKLREMMDQAGIQLGQATVNTGTPNQQQNASQQQGRGSSSANFGAGADDAEINVAVVPRPVASGGQGLVDTFA